ncbi:MAG: UDP-N-acetylmuramoyl-L-alanyl-D-glutamate--2,6-diaminopimelate ligase [Spirochaetes bacterium ADurb.Bin110]|nr:MAG: UDP-N-acetylmuramoyl-L-alanyl-D-glutamate--2,6-diaminopimelate ligase [Spirochaetes bacterium ADurb.Bin110]
MQKQLSDLIKGLDINSIEGDVHHLISGLSYDSRECKAGSLFFALPGLHTDGKEYIIQAIQNGAAAVVYEGILENHLRELLLKDPSTKAMNPALIQVMDCRWTMSAISSRFFENPSDSLCVIGVTGTEGKSTTVSLIYQLLNATGFKAGFFSTVMSDIGEGEKPNPQHQTTPEATTVQQMLAEMRDHSLGFAVVEASSHGLSPRTARLAHVHFDIGLVTNVTHEHLEFHGSWEQYRSDKANLFRRLGEAGVKNLDMVDLAAKGQKRIRIVSPIGIICADDPNASYFAHESKAPCLTYSSKGAVADLSAHNIVGDSNGAFFEIEGPLEMPVEHNSRAKQGKSAPKYQTVAHLTLSARINLPGNFNVQNALGAILAASTATGLHWRNFVPLLPSLKPIKGRMQRILEGQPFEVIIDYAHTPSSFKEILPSIRREKKGRIICVFGSAGERDREKRPQQGRIAADYCDILILTDEDPRGEDPMAILEEIASSCPELSREDRLYLIPDRPAAIRKAFSLAKPEDLVLLLGKGHENSIIYSDRAIPYDEETQARSILADMRFGIKSERK